MYIHTHWTNDALILTCNCATYLQHIARVHINDTVEHGYKDPQLEIRNHSLLYSLRKNFNNINNLSKDTYGTRIFCLFWKIANF